MDNIEPHKTKITLSLIARWVFGILFFLAGIGTIIEEHYFAGILLVVTFFILIPPFAEYIEDKLNITLSGPMRAIVVVVLLLVSTAFMPNNTSNTATNSAIVNSDNIANSAEIANSANSADTTNSANSADIANSANSADTQAPTTYKVGDRVVVGGRAYTVTNVRTASTLGDEYSNVQPDGLFVIVDMTIETLEKETTQMMSNDVKVVDSQGRTFTDTTKASMYIKNDLSFKQLQPGLPSSGEIVFDVPKGITANLQVCEGGFGDKTELISLGTLQ